MSRDKTDGEDQVKGPGTLRPSGFLSVPETMGTDMKGQKV